MFYQGDANVHMVEIQHSSLCVLSFHRSIMLQFSLQNKNKQKKYIIRDAHYHWSLFNRSAEHNTNLLHKYTHPSQHGENEFEGFGIM